MRRRRGELGEGQMGCIVGLIVFVGIIFICFKMIPVKVKASELRQEVSDESKSAGTHGDDRIRRAILAKAAEVELPVKDSDIVIKRNANSITVDVNYDVPIQFPGFVYRWHFEHTAENPIF